MRSNSASKFCPKCETVRDAADFHKNRARSDGLASYCRACFKIVDRDRYVADPAKKLKLCRSYYRDNAERIGKRHADWDAKNPDKRRAITARWQRKKRDQRRKAA